ncbi:MAG: DUF1810 domain-containing protein [Sphingobacteriales bacterium]
MPHDQSLSRFIDAQQSAYFTAFSEIKNGRKSSHWMWFIFPQIQGLGFSETSRYYAIQDLHEAKAYLNHPILGARIIDICTELLKLDGHNASEVFGSPDDLKLKSSMTLFASVRGANPVFQSVLEKFFGGEKDKRTLQLLTAG